MGTVFTSLLWHVVVTLFDLSVYYMTISKGRLPFWRANVVLMGNKKKQD